jgi:hypothetical protein
MLNKSTDRKKTKVIKISILSQSYNVLLRWLKWHIYERILNRYIMFGRVFSKNIHQDKKYIPKPIYKRNLISRQVFFAKAAKTV